MMISIRGNHKSGKTWAAVAIAQALHELGMKVEIQDPDVNTQREYLRKLKEGIQPLKGKEAQIVTVQLERFKGVPFTPDEEEVR